MQTSLLVWKLVCLYRQLAPIHQIVRVLRQLGGGVVSPSAQELLLTHCVLPAEYVNFTDPDYEGRVVKAALKAAEEDRQAGCEDLLEHFADFTLLQPPQENGNDGWHYKAFAYGPLADSLLQTEVDRTTFLPPMSGLSLDSGSSSNVPLASTDVPPASPSSMRAAASVAERAGGRRASVGRQGVQGLVVLHLACNLFEGGTGGHEWGSGFRLAELLLSAPELVQGKRCLELGSGAGLVGVALAHAGARALLTDGCEATVRNCVHNLDINGIEAASLAELDTADAWCQGKEGPTVQCMRMCWEAPAPDLHPDIILGADLIYDPEIIPVMVPLLKQLLQRSTGPSAAGADSSTASRNALSRAPVALFASQLRAESSMDRFLEAAAGAGLCVQQMEVHPGVVFHHLVTEEDPEMVVLHHITADPKFG